ncbi:DUF6114 domain-containing protein [Actinoplanes sp. NBRC 101535]|uniref:DUF6114 domain-containing protein n=1 Tax=Actinoplanes sp. NBRC 101535 TaxID=3032196 RepID=UPI0024A326C7|nr:DUF6114 domain-containing protein [Actinoplanes sp. NBRC 101535]GLY08344.1 hypothetical protein Acsp01_87230 [Actinoplanes sp. NBRC 101535]
MAEYWHRFARWRRGRPFWGGLLLLTSGLEMFLSANMSVANMDVHIGPQGFLSYLLPSIMLVCGALTWLSPAQRHFYGIVGVLTALYSFIGLNLGGWIAGMLLGIVGGALAIAWGPARVTPAVPPPPAAPEPGDPGPAILEPDLFSPGPDSSPGFGPGEKTAEIRPAAAPPVIPGPDPGPGQGHWRRTALVLIAPVVVATTVLVAGDRPAGAAECPEGLPSRTSTPSSSASPSRPAPASPTASASPPPASASTSVPASASPTVSAAPDGENPILDGIGDVLDGVGDLLGIGDEETPSPEASISTSASASASASASPDVTPASERPSSPGTSAATPATSVTGSAASSPPASAPASTSASASPEEIPCLGARQEGLLADGDTPPRAGAEPGLMKTDSLTMYDSSYDGVVDVPTEDGSIRSLKFTMDRAVNTPFSLEIAEPGGGTTLITSSELTIDGNVEFYTSRFTGKLFGLIPVVFTPDQPPPLTLPVLWFTDTTIDLVYVHSDELTADPLTIRES